MLLELAGAAFVLPQSRAAQAAAAALAALEHVRHRVIGIGRDVMKDEATLSHTVSVSRFRQNATTTHFDTSKAN